MTDRGEHQAEGGFQLHRLYLDLFELELRRRAELDQSLSLQTGLGIACAVGVWQLVQLADSIASPTAYALYVLGFVFASCGLLSQGWHLLWVWTWFETEYFPSPAVIEGQNNTLRRHFEKLKENPDFASQIAAPESAAMQELQKDLWGVLIRATSWNHDANNRRQTHAAQARRAYIVAVVGVLLMSLPFVLPPVLSATIWAG